MPPPASDKTEAVTRGLGRTDAPARRRCARFQRSCRPQQQERKTTITGDEVQPLTGLEIETFDRASDRSRRGRAQSLFDGPEGLFLVRRFDQEHAGWIEAEAVETMPVKAAILRECAC